MKIRKMCNKCGYHQDKCRCSTMRKIDPKKGNRESDKVLWTYRWRKKREQIKKRDGHFCQRCWSKYNILNSERLEVHHIKNRIDYPELIFEDSNLITICKTCNLQLGSVHELDFEWNKNNDCDREFFI